jgi:hypothetical protein
MKSSEAVEPGYIKVWTCFRNVRSCGEIASKRFLSSNATAIAPQHPGRSVSNGAIARHCKDAKMRKLLFVTTAAALAMASAALAQPPAGDGPGGQGPRGQRMAPAERFGQMDANKDGAVDKTEWRGPAERFDAVDANKDGKITLQEMQAAPRGGPGGRGPGGPGGGRPPGGQ